MASCSPIKRHARLVKKYPFVHTKEVKYIHDTIRINNVRKDTVFYKDFDTILIEKERLRVQLIRSKDSIYFEGECKDTTIYKTYEYNEFSTTKPYTNYLGWITLILTILLILLILRKLLK